MPPLVPREPEKEKTDKEHIEEFKEFLKQRAEAKAMPVSEKVAYVKSQGQTRNHHCHWPGCEMQVPPALWGCKKHWYLIPKELRSRIWATYQPGQEVHMAPSREYVKVAREVQEWIEAYESGLTEHG